MTPEELQQLENGPSLRVKFASIRNDGSLASDASSEYSPFFAALAAEVTNWDEEPNTQSVQTRYEHLRVAHVLRHGETEVAAVEHETGIEILAAGVAVNLASEALIGFLSWSWNKWKQSRDAQKAQGIEKAEPSLVLEGVKVRDHTGAPKEIVRVEKRGPLTADRVAHHVREFISNVVQPEDSLSAASGTISLTFNFHLGR
jgi:hypothetical protein